MATFERRGRRWRARVRVDGRDRSKTLDTKAQAQAWAMEQEKRITIGDRDKTFGDALRRYLEEITPTKRGARSEAHRIGRVLLDPLAAVRLSDLGPEHIAAWRDRRLQAVTSGSVLRELTTINHCLTVARDEWRWIAGSPSQGVRKPKSAPARTRRIADAEIEAITRQLGYLGGPPQDTRQLVALAFLFAIETAMRAGEILSITPDAVDLEARVVHLAHTKNGEARDVPLSARAVEILGLVGCQFTMHPWSLDKYFREARDAAGIKGLRFHDTRREATSRLAKVLHPMELARVTGHKDLKMLMVYYQESASEIARKL